MKHSSIVMAIALLIGLCSNTQSQSVQTNGLRDRQITHLPIMGANVPQGISRKFLGDPFNHRLQTGFATGSDSLRMMGPSYPFTRMLSPQSQFSVIDTAIIRRTTDTLRHVFTFNAKAKMTSDLTQQLIGGLWVDILREIKIYDASNNMRSDLYEYWENSQWMYQSLQTYTYDASNNMRSELNEYWSNGQWVNSGRYTYTYDANGNMLSELHEYWSNDQWVIGTRYTYTYDANGKMLSSLEEQPPNGQFLNMRSTYTYDADGNILSWLEEQWLNGHWVNSQRFTLTNDAHGHVLSSLGEQWSNGKWVNQSLQTYTYDANGNRLSELYEYWSNDQWVNSERYTYTYDANGKELSVSYELWSNGLWVNQWLQTYTYDAQENLTSIWFYTWINSAWTPTDTGGEPFGWLFVTDSAGNDYKLDRGYNVTLIRELTVTGMASQNGKAPASYSLSQNYPNPFNPTTVVSYQLPAAANVRLVVYDLIGREVSVLVNERKEGGSHTVQFNAGGLASGVYFYRLQAGSFVQTRKLLLLR